jgi:hypothetical protein
MTRKARAPASFTYVSLSSFTYVSLAMMHACEKARQKARQKFAFRNYLALPHERVVQINTFTQPNKPHITIQQT